MEKELYPILENESIKIGTFKASRSINTLDFIKFWKSYDGHKLPEKQVKRAYYNGTRTQNIIEARIIEHANDYNTLNRKYVPSCITIDRRRSERYFSVFIKSFKEVLNVPKSYLNE